MERSAPSQNLQQGYSKSTTPQNTDKKVLPAMNGGLNVYIDPQTGEFIQEPRPGQEALKITPEMQNATSTSSEGLVEEVKRLKEMGCTKEMVSMQGLGYKEILAYLDGEYALDEAVYTIKRDTRHFAKRQLTWFRRERQVAWIQKEKYDYDEEKILEAMISHLEGKIC